MFRFWQLQSAWVSAPSMEDAPLLRAMMNNPKNAAFHDGKPMSESEANEICSGKYPWFLIHALDGKLIGVIALLRQTEAQAELCIHLEEHWRRKGIGTEALLRMKIAAYHGMGLRELFVRIVNGNEVVIPFYQRCGFERIPEPWEAFSAADRLPGTILRCQLCPCLASISVIVPLYNSESWLSRCLDSLQGSACEILLIDDHSSDRTLDIARRYAQTDDRIVLLHTKAHSMAGGARNEGLKVAKGTYIFFLDSDDYIADQNTFQRMALYASISGAECVMTSQYEEIYENRAGERRIVFRGGIYTGQIEEQMRKRLYTRQFPLWMAWYRKDFLLSRRFRFPEKVSYEDNYFSFWLVNELRSVCHVPGTLICHTIRPRSLSHIPDLEIQVSFFRVTDLCLSYAEAHKLRERFREELAIWYLYAVFFTAMHVWKHILPTDFWIVQEAAHRMKLHFPNFFADHLDSHLPPAERELLLCAWENPENLLENE